MNYKYIQMLNMIRELVLLGVKIVVFMVYHLVRLVTLLFRKVLFIIIIIIILVLILFLFVSRYGVTIFPSAL